MNDFLPGRIWSELKELLPDVRQVPLPLARPEDWLKIWRDHPAEILIGAWQIPGLQAAALANEMRSLRYLCYLAGEVRKKVPRESIANGLIVTNWGSSISGTVAECALLLMLMALRRASYWAVAMHREAAWKNPSTYTQSLLGRRVGLHGFGAISRQLVPMLRPFGGEVQAYSPHVPDGTFSEWGVRRIDSLRELFATSDIVVELAAATPENRHLVTEELLRLIPEGGVFVNVGRGAVVDEAALARVAREGKIQVALDVYEVEPLPVDSPFRGLPNVTLLPHLGGPTRDRRCDSGKLAVKNIRAYLAKKPLEAVVTLEVYDRST